MNAQTQFDNNLRGALFKNKDKGPNNPTWPDYQGNAEIDGKQFWLSAWIKISAKGETYMSLTFKPKDAPATITAAKAAPAEFNDDISDIPF